MGRCNKRDICAVLLGICTAAILWITILSREVQSGVSFYPPFHTIGAFWRDIQRGGISGNLFGNILLFIPIGVLLSFITGWKGRTVIIAAGFSLVIETTQFITSRGCFDLDDVLLNTVGCFIGYGLLQIASHYSQKKT